MEKLRRVVNEIAFTHDRSKLPALHRSLIPFLSIASSIYSAALSARHCLYHWGIFQKLRLPVTLVSVGNLTWGGNGKTPMVEYIAKCLVDAGISPLILTRGYAGGDEARMLERHFLGGSVKIGVGADRAATAAWFLEKYGYIRSHKNKTPFNGSCLHQATQTRIISEEIGAAILDDGMQHWRLYRDFEVVMVNGLRPWGNQNLLPLGPLREPLTALRRADAVVIHHSDLVLEQDLKNIELRIQEVNGTIPVFYSRMAPKCFIDVRNNNRQKFPLETLHKISVLCVSGIGSAESFVKSIETIGASRVDRLDFSDHHLFQVQDIEVIRRRLDELAEKSGSTPVIVVTEKDYDRDPEILEQLEPYRVLALCSELELMSCRGSTENEFRAMLQNVVGVLKF